MISNQSQKAKQEGEKGMNLQGKTAVITGAASGIGAETALAMAENGAGLVLLDINEAGLKLQQEKLKEYPVRVDVFAVDLTDYEAVQKVGKEIYKVCDRIDILANIAGGGGREGSTPIAEISREMWDKLIELNMGTMFNCTKMVIEKMMEQKSGKIVNISSVAGVRGGPMAGKGGYAAAKAGVIGFTQTLARELGPYGVLVNAVAPGFHLTPLTAYNSSENIMNSLPLRRAGDPAKLAQLIVFLTSDDNQFITGDVICVDGGLCMH
jgi:3-oxoacyl-[acyl-carrier protein] reductase